MTDQKSHRRDRARRRAIRAQAARAGVAYSVAARQLEGLAAYRREAEAAVAQTFAGDTLAGRGRTVYPATTDTHRQALIDSRNRRSAGQRVEDARRAADIPAGRARHLVDRFPPTRGEDGTGVGLLYHTDPDRLTGANDGPRRRRGPSVFKIGLDRAGCTRRRWRRPYGWPDP
jgi:hypothetical protein